MTVYKNLKLAQNKTGKPPVFIGPVLLHQNSEWKTISKFAHCLTTEQPSLAGIQAYGSDGEKALTDGFKRNFQFAFGLRCFIHFKKNIEKDLSEGKFNGLLKSDFMLEIFGKQEGELKYPGLIDCKTGEEFDEKLSALKPKWDECKEVLKEGKL